MNEIEKIKITIDKAMDKALEEAAKNLLAEAYKDIDRQIFFYHLYEGRL